MKAKEKVAVVFAGDNKYVLPMGVAIKSLSSNFSINQTYYYLNIYIIDIGITEENKNKLQQCCPKTRKISLFFLSVPELNQIHLKPINIIGTSVSFNYTVLARLFIPKLLYKKHRKVIYIDSDTLIIGDILELWKLEVPDNFYIAACLDPITQTHQELLTIKLINKTIFEYKPKSQLYDLIYKDKSYFNSGVLIFTNIQELYDNNFTEKIIKIIEDNQFSLPDQHALNIYFKDKVTYLSHSWNYDIILPITGKYFYKQEFYQEMKDSPAKIVHFSGNFKPWDGYQKRPFTQEWFNYLEQTPWKNWRSDKKLYLPIHYKIVRCLVKLLTTIKYKHNFLALKILDKIIFVILLLGISIFTIGIGNIKFKKE